MAGIRGKSGPPGNLNGFQHGLTALDRRLKAERLDRRSFVYKWVKARADDYASALGGDPSPQEKTIIWDAAMSEFYESQIDGHLSRKKLIRKGHVDPTLSERTRLAAHIRENLKVLRISRRPKPVSSLEDYVREKYGSRDADENDAGAEQDSQESTNEATDE